MSTSDHLRSTFNVCSIMKSILLFFIFLLFLDGVFGESVSVMEGDSVILHTGLTEIQKNDVIDWRFGTGGPGSDRIARINRPANIDKTYDDELGGKFKDRLKLQVQNGDLTIRNIRTTDSGVYKVTSTTSNINTFSVSVVPVDAVKSVTVMEGDSVTLQTDIQRYDMIQWRFEHQNSPVAEINRMAGILNTSAGPDGRFRDRLQLVSQTGSLTIKNIGTNHSGLYEVEITSTSSSYTIHHTKSFNVTVRAHVKSVSVKEGDSVTLHPDLTEIQETDQILWKFGEQDILIARLKGSVNNSWSNVDLNPQTGDLNIRNIRKDQDGDYKVEIITRIMILHRKYRITLDAVKSVSVKRDSVTLPIGTEIQSDDVILWMFGDTQIAKINKADQQFPTSFGLDERYRDRLQLDPQTGSLTIINTRTTDLGVYKVKISSSRRTINRNISVTVIGSDLHSGSDVHSGSGLSPGAVAGIVVGGVVVILVAAVGVICYRNKISKQESRMEEYEQNHKRQDTDDPANEEAKLAKIETSSNL